MSPEIPAEWFELAEQDVRVARAALEQNLGEESAAFHIHEAAEKALKAYLITTGWELSKTHVLPALVRKAGNKDGRFSEFRVLCSRIDDYLRMRYPPFPKATASTEEMLVDLAEVEGLVKLARQVVRETLG